MTVTTNRTVPIWPLALPYLRVGLVALAALSVSGLLVIGGQPAGIAAVSSLSAFYLLPVNVASVLIVRWRVHREGSTLRAMIGLDRTRLGRDILWGFLWIVVLYIPFALAIMGTMFALFGVEAFTSFEAVFAPDPRQLPALGVTGAWIFGILVVLSFAPINAPTEEVVFRGYSQGGLRSRPVLAVLLPSIAFGIQHLFFASTVPGMVVYAVAFFVWGLGSALIYRWHGRLMPLIVAHFVVNLLTSLPAIVIPFFLT